LTVFVPEISAKDNLLRRINLSGNVLTPNEDGINDKIEVDLLVVKTSTEPEVTIYDLAGRQVAKAYIVNDEKYQWDGRDIGGMLLPPGSYILEVKVAADVRTDVQQRIINLVY
jgi:gliding motility-associated-like protein